MTNPFENSDALFLALQNDERQYSLWPSAIAIPAGWVIILGPASRANCIEHIEKHWTDMRPNSLKAALPEEAAE